MENDGDELIPDWIWQMRWMRMSVSGTFKVLTRSRDADIGTRRLPSGFCSKLEPDLV